MGRGLQLDLDDGSTVHLPLLAWMDDVYVLASSPDELQSMIREICLATAPAGLKLQPDKCMWSTNVGSCTAELSVQGLPLQRVPSSEGLEILGTLVCLNGDNGPELDARVTKAWRAFWANAPLLNPRVHPHRRLKLLESIVTPCVLWGAGALTATAQQLQRLDVTHRAMAASILRIRLKTGEPWVPWFRRSRREAGRALQGLGIALWGT